MSLHCFVIPHALATHAAHAVRHITRAAGVGRRAATHTPTGAIPHMAPAAAPPVSCSAPVQALRAMRALAGTHAAALVAGGMTLGGLGAGVAGVGTPGIPYGAAGGGGGSYAAAAPSTARTAALVPSAGQQVAVDTTPDNGSIEMPADSPPTNMPITYSAPPDHAPLPDYGPAPDYTPPLDYLPKPPPIITNAAPPTAVPEPAGLAWLGLLAATGAGLGARRLPQLRRRP